jgi:hypothetical protein
VRTLALLTLAASWAASWAAVAGSATPPPQTEAASAPVEEVVVTGEQPGPGLWRVSRDGHDLWILGTLEPLPKKMSWRATQTDAVIARSSEVLAPPGFDVHVSVFRGLTAIPTALRARKNADGETLAQVLPADLYHRWLVLKERYLGRGEAVERYRPLFAARELYVGALDHSGLSSEKIAWKRVKESAKRWRVPLQPVDVDITVKDPKAALHEIEHIARDPDVACLARTIEQLESDVGTMRARANLWSLGDVDGLRALPYPDARQACFDAVASVPELGRQMTDARDRLFDHWLATALEALARNPTTFAVLPISELLRPDGPLARLRAQGFLITDP